MEELKVDEGWREAEEGPQFTSSTQPTDMSNMSKTEKRAAQVNLITNKVRWYCLTLAKFVNGM